MRALWIVVALLALTGCPAEPPTTPKPAPTPEPTQAPQPAPDDDGCGCECHTGDAVHIEPCCGPLAPAPAPAGTPIELPEPNQYGCRCGCHSGEGIMHEAPCCGPDAPGSVADREQDLEESQESAGDAVPDGEPVPLPRNPDYKGDCGCGCHHNPRIVHVRACCGPGSRN
jgi:hypothetical protein